MVAKLASVMPALPDKLVLVNPVREVTAVRTNAVVANCVVLVNAGAVLAVGVPVKEGERMVAFNNKSAVLVVGKEIKRRLNLFGFPYDEIRTGLVPIVQ